MVEGVFQKKKKKKNNQGFESWCGLHLYVHPDVNLNNEMVLPAVMSKTDFFFFFNFLYFFSYNMKYAIIYRSRYT